MSGKGRAFPFRPTDRNGWNQGTAPYEDSLPSQSRSSGAEVEGSASEASMPIENPITFPRRRQPWNKGRLIGQKRPRSLTRIVQTNLRAVQLLLGHTKLESTVRYLGIEVDDALTHLRAG